MKSFADDLVSGKATEEQAHGVRAVLQKLGPVGAVLWDQVKDFGARALAQMAKP